MPFSQILAEFQAPGSSLPHFTAAAAFLVFCASLSRRLDAKPGPVVLILQWLVTACLTRVWLQPEPDSAAWAIPAIVFAIAALINTLPRKAASASTFPTYSPQQPRKRRKKRTSTSTARVPGIG